MDDQQRARAQFEAWAKSAAKTVHGFNRVEDMWDAWQAATAALRAAPDGFVMVPVEPPVTEMWEVITGSNLAAIDEIDGSKPNAERHERLGWFLLAWPELLAMLAARPQGVKDAT